MGGRLDGEHILVTGGSRGIGVAIVERALTEGARVSIIAWGPVSPADVVRQNRCNPRTREAEEYFSYVGESKKDNVADRRCGS
jgi:NAD(P)-dependent dehydrogenase (short-subunit alcohol dehydrogenase family)